MLIRHAATATIAIGLLAVAPASAQDALGSGRALDRNLGQNTGGVNPAAPPIDFRSRNSIVTNNIIGGRGFRESVGYGAEGAFQDDVIDGGGSVLGSDDLYEFRRGSAWSDVNLVNFGSTYQRFRFGQDAGLLEYARVGEANLARSITNPEFRPWEAQDRRLRLDRLSFATLTANAQQALIQPTVVGSTVGPEGQSMVIRASSLGGLERTPLNQVGELIGLTGYDFARAAEDFAQGRETETSLGSDYTGSYSELLASTRIETTPGGTLVSPTRIGGPLEGETEETDETAGVVGDPALLEIRQRVAERFAQIEETGAVASGPSTELTEEMLVELEEDLQALRDRLAGRAETDEEEDAESSRPGGRLGMENETTLDDIDPDKMLERRPTDPDELPDFGEILQHGRQIDRLATPEDATRFNELLASAEQALREGRYFWAERRFNRALRFTPGHPLATAGLVHTQIGAGLYLSASLTLRSLYAYQPEMIDARFAEDLLPNRPRLLAALETLEARMGQRRDRTATALLYAYIGRLLEERDTIERGLDVMGEDSPDDPLLPLLRAIWLSDDADSGVEDAEK